MVPLPFALQRYVNVGGRVNPQIWKLIFKGGKKGGSRKSINEEVGGRDSEGGGIYPVDELDARDAFECLGSSLIGVDLARIERRNNSRVGPRD